MTVLPSIIFTDSLGEMEFISMESNQFIELVKLLNIQVLFSAYNGIIINDDFLYLIHDGIIFVPHSGNIEVLESFFNIRERGGFLDLFSFLAAKRIEIDNYNEFKEFKNSKYFGNERSNFLEFLEAKKNTRDEMREKS